MVLYIWILWQIYIYEIRLWYIWAHSCAPTHFFDGLERNTSFLPSTNNFSAYIICETVGAHVYNILLSFLCQIGCITWCSCRKRSNNIRESCGSRLQTDMGPVSGRLTWYFSILLYQNTIVLPSAFYGNETIWIVKNVIL
jgi:hypothetical protein